VDDLQTDFVRLEQLCAGLEKERNFYFGKLREVEVKCVPDAEEETTITKEEILTILYRTDDNGEFQQPDEVQESDDDTF